MILVLLEWCNGLMKIPKIWRAHYPPKYTGKLYSISRGRGFLYIGSWCLRKVSHIDSVSCSSSSWRLLSIINFLPLLCTGPAILHWTNSQKNEIQILSHTNFYLLVFLGHQISVSWSVQIQKCLLLPEVVAPIMAINLLSCIILALTTYRVFGTEISTIDCGTITAKLESRMSGGEKTDRGQWPFLAALFTVKEEENDFYCGGSLISPRHVLTGIVACTFY